MTQKYLLLIDDEPDQKEIWSEYLAEIADKRRINIEFDYINPLDFLDGENGFKTFKDYLEVKILNKKIDLVATDYNWSDKPKRLAFQTIDFIREHNKGCNVFMYSGGLREMLNYVSEDNNKGQDRILKILTKSTISDFVRRTPQKLIETTELLLVRPSIILQIETYLLKFENLSFEYGYSIFEGKTLGEIAIEVRKQSENGIKYTQYIIEKGLNHMINLEIPIR